MAASSASSASSPIDYTTNHYIAVTLQSTSPFYHNPAHLPAQTPPLQPYLTYVGPVGSLQDVQLYSIPKSIFESVKDQVFATLEGMPDVSAADVQVPKQRAKRGGDEL